MEEFVTNEVCGIDSSQNSRPKNRGRLAGIRKGPNSLRLAPSNLLPVVRPHLLKIPSILPKQCHQPGNMSLGRQFRFNHNTIPQKLSSSLLLSALERLAPVVTSIQNKTHGIFLNSWLRIKSSLNSMISFS